MNKTKSVLVSQKIQITLNTINRCEIKNNNFSMTISNCFFFSVNTLMLKMYFIINQLNRLII